MKPNKKLKKYTIQKKLFVLLTFCICIIAFILYYLIPVLLNYPKGTYGTNFQTELEGTNYFLQIFTIAFAVEIALSIILFIKTKFISKNFELINNPSKYTEKDINKLKNTIFYTPYSLFNWSVILPCVILFITSSHILETTLKLVLLLFCLLTIFMTAMYIYSTKLFKDILLCLPLTNTSTEKSIPIRTKFFYNIIPVLFASLLFIALFGYSKVTNTQGNSEFEAYHNELVKLCDSKNFNTLDELIKTLSSINLSSNLDYIFIKLPDNSFIDLSKNPIKVSDFFQKYLNEFSPNNRGRVYEYYGMTYQATTLNININNTTYTVGIYFKVLSNDTFVNFMFMFMILFLINYAFINLFSSSLTFDIKNLINNFKKMQNNTNDAQFIKKITPITNDEIAELCLSYNFIQELTFNNFKTIQNNQEILIEQERLASLGQMIGGIAHNLKTPIFSVAGGLEGLSDLINEYDMSIGNPQVTEQDFHDIASDMRDWIEKLKGHISYMSDVITAVKGQTVTLSESTVVDFTISELFKRVDILMKHEIKNSLATLDISNNVPDTTLIKGNINSLVQIINNMISNALEAYGNNYEDKRIELKSIIENNNIIISIKDYGPGISEVAQEKLFKEMITTKGKNGTGLGMFMSYSNIKAHFNGDLTYETEIGKGTTFYITLPMNN